MTVPFLGILNRGRLLRRAATALGIALLVGYGPVEPLRAQDQAVLADSNMSGAELVLGDMTYVVSHGSRNEMVVVAGQARFNPKTDSAELEEIHARMGSKAPGGVPGGGLEMRCQRGTFDLGSRDFVASGNVRGVTADGRRFKTRSLTYRAAEGLVSGNENVILRDRGAWLEGSGFEYFVREDRFKLRDARIREGS